MKDKIATVGSRTGYRTNFNDPGEALAYIADCTLATVCDMACKKSRRKHEYERQISIAQVAIDAMKRFGVSYSGTRAMEVDEHGSVQAWAKFWEQKMVLPHAQLIIPRGDGE